MRRSHTTYARDAALRQLGRINRWMIAGSVVLTGVLADVASNAFPGKTAHAAGTAKASKPHAKSSHGASKTTTGVLRPPAQAPKASSESESSQQATPPQPAQEAPAGEAPAQEAPAQESAPAQEPAPAQEAPAQEAPREAAPEETGPVVSGGS